VLARASFHTRDPDAEIAFDTKFLFPILLPFFFGVFFFEIVNLRLTVFFLQPIFPQAVVQPPGAMPGAALGVGDVG
jgi:hypothetical protein